MFKRLFQRIETWLISVLRAELTRVEKASVGLYAHTSNEIFALKQELSGATAGFKDEIQAMKTETAALRAHVTAEVGVGMVKRYDQIMDDAYLVAHTAVAEARKTLRLPCSLCGQLSWKFLISAVERKPVCLDCDAKGRNK